MNKLLLVLLITLVIATIAVQYGMAEEEEHHARLKRQWGWGGWGRPGWGGGWRRPWGWGGGWGRGWGGGWGRGWGGWGRR
ncbi:hypothetical protein ACQ4LE_009380 [Meloidogyne hapla]